MTAPADPATAILVLGVPEGAEVSLDLGAVVVGPRFRGFHGAAAGRLHFVAVRPQPGEFRAGAFVRAPGAVRWSGGQLLPQDVSSDRSASAAGLGPAPASDPSAWAALTDRIDDSAAAGCAAGALEPWPSPQRLGCADAAEITAARRDPTRLLERMPGGVPAALDRLLADSAAAFVSMLLGDAADGLQLWRSVVQPLCASRDAAVAEPRRYAAFLRAFSAQLARVAGPLLPDDMAADHGCDEPFLVECLRTLRDLVDDPDVCPAIRAESAALVDLYLPSGRYGLVPSDELPILWEEEDTLY
jgi:hypothetical protein